MGCFFLRKKNAGIFFFAKLDQNTERIFERDGGQERQGGGNQVSGGEQGQAGRHHAAVRLRVLRVYGLGFRIQGLGLRVYARCAAKVLAGV